MAHTATRQTFLANFLRERKEPTGDADERCIGGDRGEVMITSMVFWGVDISRVAKFTQTNGFHVMRS